MDIRFALLLLCFLLSGFSALLYQTAWAREFSFVFGTSDLAVAAVLAGYMGGLALGSAAAARIAPRVQRPVLAYGLLELGVALCALAMPLALHGLTLLYVGAFGGGEAAEPGALATLFRLLGAFALLLPPTALMGATLPLLARHAIRRDEEVGPRIGALYATNTAGAILGTLCAAFLLLPAVGLRRTVVLGALVNGLVFLAAAALTRGAPPPVAAPPLPTGPANARGWILPLMLASGAVSFSYEVLWTRLLSQLLGGSIYAFATMLASFLLGISVGGAVGGRLARRPQRAAPAFALAQTGIAVFGVGAFMAADALPGLAARLGAGGLAGPLSNAPLAAAVLLPMALCIGATFPLAVRVLAADPAASAGATARVYAWNTVGAIIGSVGAGFVLMPRAGFAGSVVIAAAASLAVAIATGLLSRPRPRASLVAAALAAAALAILPVDTPWRLLRSSPLSSVVDTSPVRYYAVGRSSTVLLLERPGSFKLLTNGLPESTITTPDGVPGLGLEARWLGLLPVMLKPDTDRLLMIGLGGGTALEGVPPSVGHVDVVELEREVVEANREIGAERAFDPLAEPRTRVFVNDARGALLLSDQRYDAIVSQPSHPWTAGASHLYTREFFQLARDRLVDDGIFVQWIGLGFVDGPLLESLVATLADVFPHVRVYQPVPAAVLFAASAVPHDLSGADRAIAASAEHFARHGILVPEDAASALVLDDAGVRAFAAGAPQNRDDHNLLATRSARLGDASLTPAALLERIADHDPLPALAARFDPVLLARSLARRGADARVRSLADVLPEAEKQTARGFLDLERGHERSAERRFRRALALAPGSRAAGAGAALLDLQGVPEAASEGIATLRRARGLRAREEWDLLAALDAELARLDRDGLLSDASTQLRVDWRLHGGDPQRAAEALALLDVELPRGGDAALPLRRAEAAHLAGRDEAAWVALEDLSRRLVRRRGVRAIALRALALLDSLPDHGFEREIEARLRRAAR